MIMLRYLNILVNIIIKTYLKDSICIMHTFEIDTEVVHLLSPSILIANAENFQLDTQRICRHFLLHCDNATNGLSQIESFIKFNTDGFYNDRKYMMIINNQNAFEEFFNSSTLKFIRDILVIYVGSKEEEVFNLYTHKYVGTENHQEPILLDIWYIKNESFKFSNDLFPDKVRNQQGRNLRIFCVTRLPYSQCSSGFNDTNVIGNEHNIIIKYAQRFNLTLKQFPKDIKKTGTIFANWTSNGAARSFVSDGDDYTDVFYSGFPQYNHVDCIRSVRYTYEVSVPRPKRKYDWFQLMDVFNIFTWIMIVMFFSVARLLVRLNKHLQTPKNTNKSEISNLTIYAFSVNQATNWTSDMKSSIFLKYLVVLMLFSSVLFVTAYNSRLSSVMVAPIYEENIDTLDEFAISKYELLFFDPYYDILLEDTREIYKKITKKIYVVPYLPDDVDDFELSAKLLASGKYAVARYRRSSGEYYEEIENLQQMHGKFKTITPELFTDYYYIMTRKNSMHTEEIRKLVQNAEEAGLMEFWNEDGLRVLGNTTFHMHMQNDHIENMSNTLGLIHLKGCFGFWMVGMVAACIAFLIEKIYDKRPLPVNYYIP